MRRTLRALRRPSGREAPSAWCPRRARFAPALASLLPLPRWLVEADLDFYAGEFTRTGSRGGLNWYRNINGNWELLAPFAGAKVEVPALYVAGDRDLVVRFRAWAG